jgi:predicted ATPase/DNA-binding SARP family transcriptional activator
MLTEIGNLDFRLFGNAEVLVCGAPMPPLHSRRGLWLLALLALHNGRTISRSKLAGLLWPDSDESTALYNLRQTLADLRRALGPLKSTLVAEPDHSLRLDLVRVQVDVHTFDAGCADEDTHAIERALELYTGPLLEGCDEAWAIEEREPRAAAYLSALEQLAGKCASTGDHRRAVSWLRRAVAADPYRESVRRALMQSLTALGEFTAAQEVYRDLRALLHRELNSQPDPMTTQVYQEIRHAPAPIRAAASSPGGGEHRRAHRLPASRTNLIGRDADIQAVCDLLAQARLVTLTGPGGIGKTRLATEIARRIEEQSTIVDSVSFASLADIASPTEVLTAVSSALGVPEVDGRRDMLDALEQHLGERCELIVIDNCEHVLEASAHLIDAVTARCPHTRILATSQHAIGMPGEVIWRVLSLALPPRTGASGADALSAGEYSAVQLFVERARAVDSSFRLTPANAPAIVQACLKLDGIPLAIELGAARVRSLAVTEISARLGRGFEIVAGGGPATPARHQTLQSAFKWSWQLLSDSERALLSRLSVFTGGWTLQAAEAVCTDDKIAQADILELLTSLVDKSLVVYLHGETDVENCLSSQQARYHLLQTVRQFAAARLLDAGERESIAERHLEYFLDWAEEVQPNLWLPDQAIWFERLERDHDNLRAALDWARMRQRGMEQEVRLVSALSRFWDTYGHLREGSRHLEVALSRWSEKLPAKMHVGLLVRAGWAAGKLGDLAAARSHYELVLSLIDADDHASRAAALTTLAYIISEQGDYKLARSMFEETLDTYRMLGHPTPWAVLNNLGDLEFRHGNIEAARSYFLECTRGLDMRAGSQKVGITMYNLAEVELRLGMLAEAADNCEKAIRAWKECGALVEMPGAIELMGHIAARRGDVYHSARLLGAAKAFRDLYGMQCGKEVDLGEISGELKRCLGAEVYAVASAEGSQMSLEDTIAYALSQ